MEEEHTASSVSSHLWSMVLLAQLFRHNSKRDISLGMRIPSSLNRRRVSRAEGVQLERKRLVEEAFARCGIPSGERS
jgi:hypothetical protein